MATLLIFLNNCSDIRTSYMKQIVSSACLEGLFGVGRSTDSFIISGVHGYIKWNCVVVVVVWLRAGGSGVR